MVDLLRHRKLSTVTFALLLASFVVFQAKTALAAQEEGESTRRVAQEAPAKPGLPTGPGATPTDASRSSSPKADAGEKVVAKTKSGEAPAQLRGARAEEPITIDWGAHLGGSYRIGEASSLTITDRAGLVAGGSVLFSPMHLFAIGAVYEHVNLGNERFGELGIGNVTAEREMHALWMNLRVHPVRRDDFALFLDVGAGLAWQIAEGSGVIDPEGTGRTATIYVCDASDSASFAMRAGAGVEVPIGHGLFVVGDVAFENARLSGEVLDGCIPGAGSTALLAARAGLAYRLDITRLFRGSR